MANTIKNLYCGTITTSNATLYTVPSSTKTIVKEIIICNKTAGQVNATISFDGKNIVSAKGVAANDTLVIELHSVMETSKSITGFASSLNALDVYISGVEVV